MRIIERGTPPSEQPVEFRCCNCKTIFECMKGEIERVSDQRDGDFWKSTCPVCHKMVTA